MASNKIPVYSTNGLSHSIYSFIRPSNKPHSMTGSQLTIDPSDLKSTSDDALLPYLTTLPAPYTFSVDHSKSNIRFLLGYSAVAIAGFTFYADRKLNWEATTSPWIIAAVVSYFILNSALTLWIWAVEAGEVFSGKRKTGETVCVFFRCFCDHSKDNARPKLCKLLTMTPRTDHYLLISQEEHPSV